MSDPRFPLMQIESLLGQMSVPEKVGQIFMMTFDGPGISDLVRHQIQQCHVGGLILYRISGNLQSLEQIRQLTQEIQSLAQIPLLIATDQEGGSVTRLPQPATDFPSAMTVGATRSVQLARAMGQGLGKELRALGIMVNFAPVVDVNSNPRNPIIGTRAFGSDPEWVIRLAQAMVEGHRQAGVIPTIKHFPGHGDTAVDSHLGLPRLEHGIDHLQQIELRPFQVLIQQGIEMVMTAHVEVPALGSGDLPATLSAEVLETWLRRRLGFAGVIITDSLTMGALDRIWGGPAAAELAFRAGADLLLFGADRGHTADEGVRAYQHVLAQVQSGVISEARLNDSVRRILKLKAEYGLFDPQDPQVVETDRQEIGSPTHHQMAQQIAAAGITIVKQTPGRIPLHREQSVLVIWPQSRGDLAAALSLHHPQIRAYPISLNPTDQEIQQARILAVEFEQILVATYNALDHPQQGKLIRALPQTKMIVAAIGSPYDLLAFPEISTYTVSYGDLSVSLSGLAQVLLAQIPAQGTLPIQLSLDSKIGSV